MARSPWKLSKVLEKFSKTLEKEVGAKEINIGELKGDFTSKLQFEDKTIEIAFDKIICQC